jgi:hypothetical protein
LELLASRAVKHSIFRNSDAASLYTTAVASARRAVLLIAKTLNTLTIFFFLCLFKQIYWSVALERNVIVVTLQRDDNHRENASAWVIT